MAEMAVRVLILILRMVVIGQALQEIRLVVEEETLNLLQMTN
jgi:hypothetical protein